MGHDLLRFFTCGSVDDGKSTLIGRLLHDSRGILDDQLAALEKDSKKHGTLGNEIDLALLVDGLEAERQQGITIDVAYRFFSTKARSFIVADSPGHVQYTRNMATAASNSEVAVILIDARKGVLTQTRRHLFICSLLGIADVIVAVNKIDLVDFDQTIHDRIVADCVGFASPLGFRSIAPVPISARFGDNVMFRSERTPWYAGPSLLEHLEGLVVEDGRADKPMRFPVQWVNRPNPDFRGFSGTVASGRVAVGDPIVVTSSGKSSRIARIVTADGDLPTATAGDAVTLTLDDEIAIERGDLLVPPASRPEVADQFAAHIVWMDEAALLPGRAYLMRIGNRWTTASVTSIRHRIDVDTTEKLAARTLALNEIGLCNLSTTQPVPIEPYQDNRATGAFILVDRYTNRTAGAGMVKFALRRASNIHQETFLVDKQARAVAKQQKPAVMWLTGLSASGKSSIAKILESSLHAAGRHTFSLDGDNIRHGLCRDLGFTDQDRVENIRRVGEVARLLVDAGLIVICSFISPFRAERAMVRGLFEAGEFIEIFVDTSLDECKQRDPKGLYAKALAGGIKNFTGIDSPYEPPEAPEIHLVTSGKTAAVSATELLERLTAFGILSAPSAGADVG